MIRICSIFEISQISDQFGHFKWIIGQFSVDLIKSNGYFGQFWWFKSLNASNLIAMSIWIQLIDTKQKLEGLQWENGYEIPVWNSIENRKRPNPNKIINWTITFNQSINHPINTKFLQFLPISHLDHIPIRFATPFLLNPP